MNRATRVAALLLLFSAALGAAQAPSISWAVETVDSTGTWNGRVGAGAPFASNVPGFTAFRTGTGYVFLWRSEDGAWHQEPIGNPATSFGGGSAVQQRPDGTWDAIVSDTTATNFEAWHSADEESWAFTGNVPVNPSCFLLPHMTYPESATISAGFASTSCSGLFAYSTDNGATFAIKDLGAAPPNCSGNVIVGDIQYHADNAVRWAGKTSSSTSVSAARSTTFCATVGTTVLLDSVNPGAGGGGFAHIILSGNGVIYQGLDCAGGPAECLRFNSMAFTPTDPTPDPSLSIATDLSIESYALAETGRFMAVAYREHGTSNVKVAFSDNRGATWSDLGRISGVVLPATPKIFATAFVADTIWLYYLDNVGDVKAAYSSGLAVQENQTPSEFDSGLLSFINGVGFKTPESQFFFTLILVGIVTVAAGSALHAMSPGRAKVVTISVLAMLVAVFAVYLAMLELWMLLLAIVLGGFSVHGAREFRNTWREVRELIAERGGVFDEDGRPVAASSDQFFEQEERERALFRDSAESAEMKSNGVDEL